MASNNLVQVSAKISIAGIVGGMGGLLQKISGTSTVFLDCKGQPITKELCAGETIEVDEDHIIAMQGISEHQLSSCLLYTSHLPFVMKLLKRKAYYLQINL